MDRQKLKHSIIEIKDSAAVLFLVVFVMVFMVSQNKISSGSMLPTLHIKDRIMVSMVPYYYRSPKRGEIVVFNGPNHEKWVKRVIGLPGETIDIIKGNVYINGKILDESKYLYEEGISSLNPVLSTVVTYPYRIPEGFYFLLGDNRLESNDCRYMGAIAETEITGKVLCRIYPFRKVEQFS